MGRGTERREAEEAAGTSESVLKGWMGQSWFAVTSFPRHQHPTGLLPIGTAGG